MSAPIKTPEGKWLLFDREGNQFARWPVDAKDMLDCDEFTLTPPDGVEPNVPDAPPSTVQPPKKKATKKKATKKTETKKTEVEKTPDGEEGAETKKETTDTPADGDEGATP